MKRVWAIALVALMAFGWVAADLYPLESAPVTAGSWTDAHASGKDCRSIPGGKVGIAIEGWEYDPIGGITLRGIEILIYDPVWPGRWITYDIGNKSISGSSNQRYTTVYTGKNRVSYAGAYGTFSSYDDLFDAGTDMWVFCYQ